MIGIISSRMQLFFIVVLVTIFCFACQSQSPVYESDTIKPLEVVYERTAADEQPLTYKYDTIRPLEGKLLFGFEEVNGQFTLKLRTQKSYGCSNWRVGLHSFTQDSDVLEVNIRGIAVLDICSESEGPAREEIVLGDLAGDYQLVFAYNDLQENYKLSFTPTEILLTPTSEFSLTEADVLSWQRLPVATIWFVVHDAGYREGNKWYYSTRSDYEYQATEFFSNLEELGAKQFTPVEGKYTNFNFIPPWETWQKPRAEDENWIKIPLEESSWYELRWPDIRYYQYGGDWANIEALVNQYGSKDIAIWGYNWAGSEIIEMGKRK